MKAILITSENCSPCREMKEQYAKQLASGEIEELNFEQDPDRVTEMIQKYGADIPGLLIFSDNGDIIAGGSA